MSAGRLRAAALVAVGWCALAFGLGCTVLDGDLFPKLPDAGLDAGIDAGDAGPDAPIDGPVDAP